MEKINTHIGLGKRTNGWKDTLDLGEWGKPSLIIVFLRKHK